ncbi:alcohol dehydrogenase GroES-like domain-containing protein [Penicillium brevicompactum]|uniref:Alcohol dehydrogenase GroES-like domain-containing protein n=1 Tax=Penicillium brevicompactum TaxID=5074 RepID=A0A9W9U662_PENBR|nr:alcohol dehydrogenase GroES-like domain-containing protein [Penicillium brevicompactum]
MSQLQQQMKAARLVEYNTPYTVEQIKVPEIGDNDILFRVGAAGYCHTDYQVWEGVYQTKTPSTPSHEPVGTIVAMGPAVKGWRIGDRIGALLFRPARANVSMAGIKDDGAMAEFMIADAANTVKLPDSVSFEQGAPLMCAGTTVWGGIKAANLAPKVPVGVIGIGGLGSLAIQFLKALGHPTVAIDHRPEPLDLAVEVPLKADLVIDSTSETAVEDITRWADNEGLAAVIVCTDDVPVNDGA